jgi:hypothetical protein
VAGVNSDGTYDIKFDDGDSDGRVAAANVRPIDAKPVLVSVPIQTGGGNVVHVALSEGDDLEQAGKAFCRQLQVTDPETLAAVIAGLRTHYAAALASKNGQPAPPAAAAAPPDGDSPASARKVAPPEAPKAPKEVLVEVPVKTSRGVMRVPLYADDDLSAVARGFATDMGFGGDAERVAQVTASFTARHKEVRPPREEVLQFRPLRSDATQLLSCLLGLRRRVQRGSGLITTNR